MEYLVEFNSFIKRFKDAIKNREEVKIDVDELILEIKNILTFIDDEPNIDVDIKKFKSSSYANNKVESGNRTEMVYMGEERDFINIIIKHNGEDSGYVDEELSEDKFDINIVKGDILSMIEYISKKYNLFKLDILVREPRKKVKYDYGNVAGVDRAWVKSNSKSYEVGLKTFEDLDGYFDAVKISIIL